MRSAALVLWLFQPDNERTSDAHIQMTEIDKSDSVKHYIQICSWMAQQKEFEDFRAFHCS